MWHAKYTAGKTRGYIYRPNTPYRRKRVKGKMKWLFPFWTVRIHTAWRIDEF